MNYSLNVSDLENQSIEVRQFEHNVTTVETSFTSQDISADIVSLTPCILLSIGEKVTTDNGLGFTSTQQQVNITWTISEECTRRAGTFLAQFAFSDEDGNVKAYTEKFVFKVLPSVDIQKAIFENRPRFVEALWKKITEKIAASIPSKVSDLENDKGFVSTVDDLAEYAKTADIDETLTQYAKMQEVTTLLSDYKNSRKPKVLSSIEIPSSVTRTSVGEATLVADTTSTYTKYCYFNKFGGSNFSLDEFTVVINSPKKATHNTNVVFALNPINAGKSGTTIYTAENLFTSGGSTIAYLNVKNYKTLYCLTYTKYAKTGDTVPSETKSFVLNTRGSLINSIQLQFVPSSSDDISTNYTAGTKIEIIATDKA